ncbi:fiber protein [Human mastadenovirus B]|uniref:Fiber protein n=1 Tax=Human mastadenovirus B TaxID=108098 RepID=A0A0K0PX90_9ADEN|nr:fiber protein [Human mastadenovirus B]
MAKRSRLSSSFNPVYPYEDESSSQHPFINPGFISPNGFTQSPDGVLTLKCVSPLTTTSGALDIKVGGGLKVDSTDGSLEENIGITEPLTKSNHSIELAVGNGLQTNESKLCVKLGEGLTFDSSNAITIKNNTLWTGAKPSTNCKIQEDADALDCKLTLVLVKNGGLVNAYVSLIGDSDYVNTLFTKKTASLSVELAFDSSGQILTSLSSLKTNLNFKHNQDMAAGTINAKGFMPSTTAYPFNTQATSSRDNEDYIFGKCYYRASYGALYTLDVTVILNRRMTAAGMAYAMNFTWLLDAADAPENTQTTLVTSPFTFSYIREDD